MKKLLLLGLLFIGIASCSNDEQDNIKPKIIFKELRKSSGPDPELIYYDLFAGVENKTGKTYTCKVKYQVKGMDIVYSDPIEMKSSTSFVYEVHYFFNSKTNYYPEDLEKAELVIEK